MSKVRITKLEVYISNKKEENKEEKKKKMVERAETPTE